MNKNTRENSSYHDHLRITRSSETLNGKEASDAAKAAAADGDARMVPQREKMKELDAGSMASVAAGTQDDGGGAAVVNQWLREECRLE
ncbi:hypothetical protein PIB30_054881, partial [Stylosanthes scabra]|nr:hypothetical protein [Stylosanthes scabra]